MNPRIEVGAWKCKCWCRYRLEAPAKTHCRDCGHRWTRIRLRETWS